MRRGFRWSFPWGEAPLGASLARADRPAAGASPRSKRLHRLVQLEEPSEKSAVQLGARCCPSLEPGEPAGWSEATGRAPRARCDRGVVKMVPPRVAAPNPESPRAVGALPAVRPRAADFDFVQARFGQPGMFILDCAATAGLLVAIGSPDCTCSDLGSPAGGTSHAGIHSSLAHTRSPENATACLRRAERSSLHCTACDGRSTRRHTHDWSGRALLPAAQRIEVRLEPAQAVEQPVCGRSRFVERFGRPVAGSAHVCSRSREAIEREQFDGRGQQRELGADPVVGHRGSGAPMLGRDLDRTIPREPVGQSGFRRKR